MRVAARFVTIRTVEQIVPFAYVAPVILGELGAAVHVVACKPFWKHALGKFVIRRTVTHSIDIKVTLDKQTLKLNGRLKVRRCEEVFDFLTKLWCFFDAVEMLVPVLRRIGKQMMVFDSMLGGRDPLFSLSCQKLRISILR